MANSIGDFIRYWGFRRIHGQIWTVLYLSQQALQPTEIAQTLKVSKALVSSALNEMIRHQLILRNPTERNKKAKHFQANPNVLEVIQSILKTRESVLVESALKEAKALNVKAKDSLPLQQERLTKLIQWTESAQQLLQGLSMHLEILLGQGNASLLPQEGAPPKKIKKK